MMIAGAAAEAWAVGEPVLRNRRGSNAENARAGRKKSPRRCWPARAIAEQTISTGAVIGDVGVNNIRDMGFCNVLAVEDFDDSIVAAEHAT